MTTKKRLLIVDDASVIRRILKKILGDTYEFVEAADGDEALSVLGGDAPFDLMICDYYLPGRNGLQVIEAKQRLEHRMALPVIMITSSRSGEAIARGKTLGVRDWINKPFVAETVVAAVAACFA